MKNLLVVLCLFLLIFSAKAQLPKKKWFPQRSYQAKRPYWAAQGSVGVKLLSLTPTLFALNYNHSPDDTLFAGQPSIVASKFAGGQTVVLNTTFALEAGLSKGLFGELRLDLLFANPFIIGFEVGGGWNFELTYYENERLLTIRPALDVVSLNNQIFIGSFDPSPYRSIAFVDEVYERENVIDFRLRNRATGLKPRLSISQAISPKWALRLDIAYLFILNKTSDFSVKQQNINEKAYILSPKEQRLGFTMNGIVRSKDLFSYDGFSFQLGIARRFGDNRDNGRKFKQSRRLH
ncbi:MAG: hypothetical protein SFU27_12565 [Thermonemataceae bacterium]|nr:hypothetical protein [Thermonemataceae bacterium]